MPFKTKELRNAWYKRKVYARNLNAELERSRIETQMVRNRCIFQGVSNYLNSDSDSDSEYETPHVPEAAQGGQEAMDTSGSSSIELQLTSTPEAASADMSQQRLCRELSTVCLAGSDSDSNSSSSDYPESCHSEDNYTPVDIAAHPPPPAAVPSTLDNSVITAPVKTAAVVVPPNLESQLFDFMFDHQVTHAGMRDLLEILTTRHSQLPRDPRTLMSRFQKTVLLRETDEFAYLGISNALQFLYTEIPLLFAENYYKPFDTIKLAFNFDGLPTSKCSSYEVWPILMWTDICPEYTHVIGVFYGRKKPTCEVLLRDLVNDLAPFLANGYKFGDADHLHKNIMIDHTVCDLPSALSLVKSMRGHGGYAACPKCTVWGEWYKSRGIYIPEDHNKEAAKRRFDNVNQGEGPNFPVMSRTDESFRDRREPHHHHQMRSPFEDLNINMISCFTIDGMHTIYLGVTRRFLDFIKSTKDRRFTLTGKLRPLISINQMKRLGNHFASESTNKFPREFSRPARNFDHFDQWKATDTS